MPSTFTDFGWQGAQVAAAVPALTAGWPVGGMPWHEVQVMAPVSVQAGEAFDPATPLKLKLPWQ